MRGHDMINACLSDELIIEIFNHLDSERTRDACSLVCRRWHTLDCISRTVLQIGANGNPDLVANLLSRCFCNVKAVFIDAGLAASSLKLDYLGKRKRSLASGKLHNRVENALLENVDFESCSLSDAGLSALGDGFPKLEKLSLNGCSKIYSLGLMSFANKCSYLRILDLQSCCVGDRGLGAVGESCKQLEELTLQFSSGFTDAGLIEIAQGCGNSLKSLGVARCARITSDSLKALGSCCKYLETLSLDSHSQFVNDEGILAVAQGCPNLKVLKLNCINVTDEALVAVGSCCYALEKIDLNSYYFTDRGLQAIGEGCKKLKTVTLSSCIDLTYKGLQAIAYGCKKLEHLEINSCHSIGKLGLKAIGKSCSHLTDLALFNCQRFGNKALLEVGRGCKFLQALRLFDCPNIGDDAICNIAKGCRNLKQLLIRRGYKVGNKGIVAIGEHCPLLIDLTLLSCYHVGDEALIAIGKGCSLQHLNVSCSTIGDAGIIAFARGCPELSHLDIGVLELLGDSVLDELGNGCPRLKEIKLSNCKRITDMGLCRLVKKCTLLETCFIRRCPEITAAGIATLVSGCPHLKQIQVVEWKVSERTKRRAVCRSVSMYDLFTP